jgi:thiosulfate dehydrogenase (quinone) large subunit
MAMRGIGTQPATALRMLSFLLGVFILSMGISKIGWLMDAGPLTALLQEWRAAAPAASRWYLETIAIPGAPVFARLVPAGELLVGTALIAGVQVRLAALVMMLMVLNFHFASNLLFHYDYLINAYGLPVLSGLLALALGGGRMPFSLSK